ncbi:MAG: outer rane biosis protein [Verrucomicrobiaceae bacterium]|nr:outer rane biosis protein [Verrucomicrobiaceae bacterium]
MKLTFITALLFAGELAFAAPATSPVFWPDKQGPTLNGMVAPADADKLPLEWDEASNKGIAWKTPLEDEGHSTPVIGGDMIWFTAATTDGTKMYLYGINRNDGKIIHHKLMFENPSPEPLGNPTNNYAAPSCVLEPDALYVHFGSYGTARVNPANGEVVWQRRDIKCRHFRGPGSSPVLFENLLILSFDGIEDNQFTQALDKVTGKDVWITKRSTADYGDLDKDGQPTREGDMRKAFCTPSFMPVGDKIIMLSCASRGAFGYDPRTGKELWTFHHSGYNAAIRPIFQGDTAYFNTGKDLVALKVGPGTQGDVTGKFLWVRDRKNASFSSTVLVNDHIIQANAACVANCVNLTDGSDTWSERLFTGAGKMFASAIGMKERVYFFSENGEGTVLSTDPAKFTVLAHNKLDSGMTSSPAVAEGALYLRTKTHLYKIVK